MNPPDTDQVDHNPFRNIGATFTEPEEARERREAPGFTGEHLHQLLVNAHVEGQRHGRALALQQAAEQYPGVWDQGYAKGREDGAHEGKAANTSAVSTVLPAVIANLSSLRGRTGSPAISDGLTTATEQLANVYRLVTGELPITLDPDAG